MKGPVLASDLLAGDIISLRDWEGRNALHIAAVREGIWTDHDGRHSGVIVTTRELGPVYELHYALAAIVQVNR